MLKTRLIPALLLKNGRCIKTIGFDKERDTGDPITAARVHDANYADELLFLDITASSEKRGALIDTISKVAEECFMPLTVGGGIRTIEDIRALLSVGADKVAITTAAVENPEFITQAAHRFGNQCIVVGIDVKFIDGKWQVFTHSGKERTNLQPTTWAKEAVKRGAGEILINSIDRDGTMKGFDLELIRNISREIRVPLIALGGAGKLSDFTECLNAGASAVSAGSIFHFTDQAVVKVRMYLKNEGFTIRT